MKVGALFAGDVRFQFKYGFYALYLLFTLLYLFLLMALPESWREQAAILMVFTDPAAMGLFFMGAIVLLEKSERVLDSLAVSPVLPGDYLLSKLLSLALISLLVALAILLLSRAVPVTAQLVLGIVMCSCLFSAMGLLIASRSSSLNQFMISTVPVQMIIMLPAIAYLFGWRPTPWLLAHPGVGLMEVALNGPRTGVALLVLGLWMVVAVAGAYLGVQRTFRVVGGMKL